MDASAVSVTPQLPITQQPALEAQNLDAGILRTEASALPNTQQADAPVVGDQVPHATETNASGTVSIATNEQPVNSSSNQETVPADAESALTEPTFIKSANDQAVDKNSTQTIDALFEDLTQKNQLDASHAAARNATIGYSADADAPSDTDSDLDEGFQQQIRELRKLAAASKQSKLEGNSRMASPRPLASLPSPVWSSDSDHRLIKAINSGRDVKVLRDEFPFRSQQDLEKRRQALSEQGAFGEAQQQMTPETPADENSTQRLANNNLPRNWTEDEDDAVTTGVKLGESIDVLVKRIQGRSSGAVKARMYKLVELGKITEQERQVVLNAAYGPDYVFPSKWTSQEDHTLIVALREGKTATQTADLLPTRSENAVLRRRLALIEMRKLAPTQTFAAGKTILDVSSAMQTSSGKKGATFGKITWTHEDDTRLLALLQQGKGWSDIARQFGDRSASSVCNRHTWLKSKGLATSNTSGTMPRNTVIENPDTPTSANNAGLPWIREEDDRLIKYVQKGMGWYEMAGLFGNRSVGSFANRYNLLEQRGQTNRASRQSSSSAFSEDDGDAGANSRKRKFQDLMPPSSSNTTARNKKPTTSRSTQSARKTVDPARQLPIADSSDSDNTNPYICPGLPYGQQPRTGYSLNESGNTIPGRGGKLMRGISRPMNSTRRQSSTTHGESNKPPRNSVDRLSGSYDASPDDGDTIYVAGASDAPGQPQAISGRRARGANGTAQNIRKSSRLSGSFTASPAMDDHELDNALVAQDGEIEGLKARLSKFKRLAKQAEEIKELKRRLAKFENEP